MDNKEGLFAGIASRIEFLGLERTRERAPAMERRPLPLRKSDSGGTRLMRMFVYASAGEMRRGCRVEVRSYLQ